MDQDTFCCLTPLFRGVAMAKVTPNAAAADVEDGSGLPTPESPPLPTTLAVMKALSNSSNCFPISCWMNGCEW